MTKRFAYGFTILAVLFAAACLLTVLSGDMYGDSLMILGNLAAGCAVEAIGFWYSFAKDREKFHPEHCFRISALMLVIAGLLSISRTWLGLFTIIFGLFGVIGAFVLDLIALLTVRFCRR